MEFAVSGCRNSSRWFYNDAFSTSLKKTGSVEVAFGSNLLGSVVGGLLEYSSLAFGLRNLMILALAMYAGSFFVLVHSKGK